MRWSAARRIRRSASQNAVSVGLCPGRCITSRVRSRSVRVPPSSSRRSTDTREPQARNAADTALSATRCPRHPVPDHQHLGERVVVLGGLAVVLDEVGEPVEGGDLRPGAAREHVEQAGVVDVLVGHHQQLEVLDRMPEPREPALELVERLPAVGPRVDERERVVLDQVGVHAPDHERRRDRQPVDPGRGGLLPGARDLAVALGRARSRADQAEHLVALLRHVLGGDERLEVEPQQRLGVRRAHVEVPVVVVDRDPVEVRPTRRRSSARRSRPSALLVLDLGVDLAGDEVLLAEAVDAARRASRRPSTAARGSAARAACRSRRSRSRGSSSGRRPRRRTPRPRRACGS